MAKINRLLFRANRVLAKQYRQNLLCGMFIIKQNHIVYYFFFADILHRLQAIVCRNLSTMLASKIVY